jgi:hypothetical protein
MISRREEEIAAKAAFPTSNKEISHFLVFPTGGSILVAFRVAISLEWLLPHCAHRALKATKIDSAKPIWFESHTLRISPKMRLPEIYMRIKNTGWRTT